MTEIICPSCEHANPANAHFCSACGQHLESDEHTMAFQVPDDMESSTGEHDLGEIHTGQALLVVQRGPRAGSRFVLDGSLTTLGRHPESDIFLDDITVSRRHAEVHRDGDRFEVRDVGSLNGTYLNRDRVEKAELSNGDELQIGKFKLVFFPAS